MQHILISVIYFICSTLSITASFSVAFGRFRSCCTVVDFTGIDFPDLAKNSKTLKRYSDKNFWLQDRADETIVKNISIKVFVSFILIVEC